MPKLVVIILCLPLLSACATVDVADMASSNGSALSYESAPEQNIVFRATSKLYNDFMAHGWVEGAGNSVAKVGQLLLKGKSDAALDDEPAYASSVSSADDIREDIRLASEYISQTKQAADVYLSTAPANDDLTDELQSLEQALNASHQAETTLKTALESYVATPQLAEELAPISIEVKDLRTVANLYGERVRARKMAKIKKSAS